MTYDELLFQASGQSENRMVEIRTEQLGEFQRLLGELTQEKILRPIKNSKKPGFAEDVYERYEIIGSSRKKETNTEFITLLHSYIGTNVFEYYRYKKEEFEEEKAAIDILYEYYRKPTKEYLTSNELGYYLFGDEKAFEQPENEKRKHKRKKKLENIVIC